MNFFLFFFGRAQNFDFKGLLSGIRTWLVAVAVAAVVVAAVAAVAVVAARSRHAYANVFCLRKPVVITEGASIQTRVKRRHENRGAPALGCIRGELFLRNCACFWTFCRSRKCRKNKRSLTWACGELFIEAETLKKVQL